MSDEAVRPVLRVVGGGEPTTEELAALVVALAMRPTAEEPAQARSPWAERRHLLRKPLQRGSDAWRWSLR